MTPPLLQVTGLTRVFDVGGGGLRRGSDRVEAVDDLSFTVERNETLALVGESGCGKTTVARCLTRLTEPTSGRIHYQGRDVRAFDRQELRAFRREVQIVFQDPFGSLNPRMTAEALIAEPLWVHRLTTTRRAARDRSRQLLDFVGIAPSQGGRYPHEFSGGQRQRIAIARALGLEPKLLILDEPVASLDTSIAAQILNLLVELQERIGVAYLLISHDLSLVRHVAHRVVVMYLGAAMETGRIEDVFARPQHPYTQALLSSVALPDPVRERARPRIPLAGDVPVATERPAGCRFHPRCTKTEARCVDQEPPLETVGTGHESACWFSAPVRVL